jgi:hypothetical protein
MMISLDVINIYMPPLNKNHNMGDDMEQHFYATDTFSLVFQDYVASNSHGFLIAGGVNAHAWELDTMAEDDAIGNDIIDFVDEFGFMVMNDSPPTYHSSVHSKTNATSTTSPIAIAESSEAKEDFCRRTAPGVVFFHTNEAIHVTN